MLNLRSTNLMADQEKCVIHSQSECVGRILIGDGQNSFAYIFPKSRREPYVYVFLNNNNQKYIEF